MSSPPFPRPAYRLLTARLELRCWDPIDSAALQALCAKNREHLLPFMPWAANEPTSVEEKLELIRGWRGNFDLGQDFTYGIFDSEGGELIGGAGLHTRCRPGGLEVGYWIDKDYCRKGLATEAAAAMTRASIEVFGVDRVEIRCAPENAASIKIPLKLGFEDEGILHNRIPWGEGTYLDARCFCLTAARYLESHAATWSVEAYDALRRRVL